MVGWLFHIFWSFDMEYPFQRTAPWPPRGGQGPCLRNPGVEVFVELLKNKEYQIIEHLGKLSFAAGLKWPQVDH